MLYHRLSGLALALLLSGGATAQIQIQLNYNFNGIVHAGEAGVPDAPGGFRSISDRALDFTAGVPNDPLLARYSIVSAPGALDIVHLGNRNTVDGGNHAFDQVPDGDDIGIQPTWLANPDQTTAQTTTLGTPLPITTTTVASFLYQVSNGGGSFDVTFTFASGRSYVATLSGPDWFGGSYLGTGREDYAGPDNNLSITEGRVDLSGSAGEAVTQISFSNRGNLNAGYAILAADFDYPPAASRVNQIPLNYNFNGIVHTGEAGMPDAPGGFRSISDRALDFTGGVPNDPVLARYAIVSAPGTLDIVHLGNRNTVDNGNHAFDPSPDGDDVGIQPTWLANPDQTTPQVTTLAAPILLDAASSASFLYQISNGGGSFDITFGFRSGTSLIATVSGGDWFGGNLPGTGRVDFAAPDANLSVTERTVDLSGSAGEVLTSIAFSNRTNLNAGYAILAANVNGCLACANKGGAMNLGGGNGPTISNNGTHALGCTLTWAVSGANPNTAGLMALDVSSGSIPLSLIAPTCSGTLHVANPVLVAVMADANGDATLDVPGVDYPSACGVTIYGQYVQLVSASCPLLVSDALGITIGN